MGYRYWIFFYIVDIELKIYKFKIKILLIFNFNDFIDVRIFNKDFLLNFKYVLSCIINFDF